MNPDDLHGRERVKAHIAGCFAMLGVEGDPMARVWRAAGADDRRFLLRLGGERQDMFSGREWGELGADLRGRIRAGLARFKAWAEKVEAAA